MVRNITLVKGVKSSNDRVNGRVSAAGRYGGAMTVLWLPAEPYCDPRKLRILDYNYGVRPLPGGAGAITRISNSCRLT